MAQRGCLFSYNSPVSLHPSSSRQSVTVWARLAACLGFLAVLSALLAPVSMLAEEVRSGKLGGVCSISQALSGALEFGSDGGAPLQSGSHCDFCTSLALALPPLTLTVTPCFVGHEFIACYALTNLATAVVGLPFSRGPPLFA